MGLLQRLFVKAEPVAQPAAVDRPPKREQVEFAHDAAPPAVVADGHWWAATPRMIVSGYSYVAGTSMRGDAVAQVVREYGRVVTAQLVPDPGNPHHAGALGVWVGLHHVGYVQRQVLADSSIRTLRRLLEKDEPTTVWARVEDVTDARGDYLGVTMWHHLTTEASRAWPFPVAFPPLAYAKVSGPAEALDALLVRLAASSPPDRTLPDKPELIVPATLSVDAGLVSVAVDDVVVGQLSAAASAKRVQPIQQVLAAGRAPIAQLRLRSDADHSRLTASLLCLEAD